MNKAALLEKIHELIDKARVKFETIVSTERDKRALLIGSSAIVIVLVYLIFHSYSSGLDNLEKRYVQLEKELMEVKALKAEYETSNKKIEQLSSKIETENEALISVVEKILLDEKIERKNFSIRDVNSRSASEDDFYEEKSVDVELNQLSLDNLVEILYKFQTKPSLKVSNLNISTKYDKSSSMKVKLRVSTYEFKQVG